MSTKLTEADLIDRLPFTSQQVINNILDDYRMSRITKTVFQKKLGMIISKRDVEVLIEAEELRKLSYMKIKKF